ncbi:transmembrane domain protein [Cryptosporidium ryanae]|uniref:transmembrane domain protein n=1 Tax=Cryptosporidium ryanae TaxID=515981 RepID=UPI003519F39E|nr:transmembrane domain protein [Cryptosporidium ryanae]
MYKVRYEKDARVQGNGFPLCVNNRRLQFLTFFSSLKPLYCWCTISSIFSLITIIINFRRSGGVFTNLFYVLIYNLTGNIVFFLLLLSRIINITSELYLTSSVTLFNDLVLTIPRYVLWELIFTSRWIWLSLNYFSATYSIIKLWNLLTFFSVELNPFLGIFFFTTSGLSFVRYFGKNQNIFLISSQKYLKNFSKMDFVDDDFYLRSYFRFIKCLITKGGEGNIVNIIIITGLSYLIAFPFYIVGVGIPGVLRFFQLTIRLFTFDVVSKKIETTLHALFLKHLTSFFVVSFYWYCVELQSSNFRSLIFSGTSEKILTKISIFARDEMSIEFIPTCDFMKFVGNIGKKVVLCQKKKKFELGKSIYNFCIFLCSLITFPSFFTILFFYIRNRLLNVKNYEERSLENNKMNIFREWSEYEYRTLHVIERLKKQLENIFSTVLLLDSSIQTKFTAIGNVDLQIDIQSILGLDRKFSPSHLKIDNWFSKSVEIDKIKENNNNIARGINDWWCCNILLSRKLNNPCVSTPNIGRTISPNWNISNSIVSQRNEIFVFLLNKMKNGSLQNKDEEERKNKLCLENKENISSEEIMLQTLFLMQEMALNTIDISILYIYCYHRFLAKSCALNGFRNELNLNNIHQFISISSEVRNQINCALELGILNSPYIHPIFEQDVLRLFRSLDDSVELLAFTI